MNALEQLEQKREIWNNNQDCFLYVDSFAELTNHIRGKPADEILNIDFEAVKHPNLLMCMRILKQVKRQKGKVEKVDRNFRQKSHFKEQLQHRENKLLRELNAGNKIRLGW